MVLIRMDLVRPFKRKHTQTLLLPLPPPTTPAQKKQKKKTLILLPQILHDKYFIKSYESNDL